MRLLEISAAVGLTAFASVGIVALGLYKSAAAEPMVQRPVQLVRVQAVLREVRLAAGEVRIGDPLKPLTVVVGDGATVFTEGRIGTLADLEIGQSVCVAYDADGEGDGRVNAEWIEPCTQ